MNDLIFGVLKVHNPRLKERRKPLTVTCQAVESRKVSKFMSTLGTPGLERFVIVVRTDPTGSILSSFLLVWTLMTMIE